MAEDMEFVGRNVQKAVQKACKILETTPDDLRYEVISHGSTGIFGLGGIRRAKIRVRIPSTETPGKTDHGDTIKGVFESKTRHSGGEEGGDGVVDGFGEGSDNLSDRMAVGEKVLQRIVGVLSPESTVHIERNGSCVKYQINKGNSGILIGKRGQTLEAIQTLVEKTVNRTGGDRVHIAVDVEKYLENRKAGLIRSAKKSAEKVKKTGRPMTMGYLNAQDRRTIHLALKDEEEIMTQSAGEGYLRKLKIYPKRRATKY